MDTTALILIIIFGTIAFTAILVTSLVLLSKHLMTKHVLYEYKGHKIEVFTYMLSAKLVVDDKLVDSGSRYGQGNYNYQFINKVDEDVIKVLINLKAFSPEIKLYINDEKQNINY